MAAWLRNHCRMSNADANALLHRGRFLDKFPAIAEAACVGVLSAGQVTSLKSSCPTPVEPVIRAKQVELVPIIAALSVANNERAAKPGASVPKHSSSSLNRSSPIGSCRWPAPVTA